MECLKAQVQKKISDGEKNDERSGALDLTSNDDKCAVDAEDSIATTKEEEWVTKKKIELTTTRQIETRVKRQVVLEDGKVVEDSGPVVTTNTTEDTEKQEHSQTEHRTLGDDGSQENEWKSISNGSGVVKEIKEKTVKSREETEERVETENVQHLGDISDEGYMTAIKSGHEDVRTALEVCNKNELVQALPKVIHQSMKSKKCIDTEDKTELSKVQPGGKVVNETRTSRLHEEVANYNISDDENTDSSSAYETTRKENFQKYSKTKEQDLTEYLANGKKIGEKINFQTETSEGERQGDHVDYNDEMNISARLQRIRMQSQNNNRLALKDEKNERGEFPVSKFDLEEETRKEETSKWLEHHFGSESTKSSKGSIENLDDIVPSSQNSFINVTMKSQLLNNTPKSKTFLGYDEEEIPFGRNGKQHPVSPFRRDRFQSASPGSEDENEYLRESHEDALNSPRSTFQDRVILRGSSTSRIDGLADYRSPGVNHSGDRLNRIGNVECQTATSRTFERFSNGKSNRASPSVVNDEYDEYDSKFEGEANVSHYPYRLEEKPKDEEPAAYRLPFNKKLYQRTRFAADIPPPPQPKQVPVKQKSKIGESFRKLVGKLRSSSTDRKNKRKTKENESRSPSPKENTYQNYDSLDSYGPLGEKNGAETEEPTAPPRGRYNQAPSRPPVARNKLLHKYYLGEDPFSGSMYGREKGYDENSNLKKHVTKNRDTEIDGTKDTKSRTLSRFSKSATRLTHPEEVENHSTNTRIIQTLPRKFREDRAANKEVDESEIGKDINSSFSPLHWKTGRKNAREREPALSHTRSLINVSFINQPYSPLKATDTQEHSESSWRGPAKPARTYRSNLSRSQSFNIEASQKNSEFQRRSHLHGLEESPPPLESPSMIFRWSQSPSPNYLYEEGSNATRTKGLGHFKVQGSGDFKEAVNLEKHFTHSSPSDGNSNSFYDRCSPAFHRATTLNRNGGGGGDDQRVNFTPVKYGPRKTGPLTYTRTFQDGNVIKTVSKSESSGNDDYSETVRIESKLEDPLHPSETNTIEIFSKKTIPSKNGHALETIESRETKTIVKSQSSRKGPDSGRLVYNASPSGVVIKVRPNAIN